LGRKCIYRQFQHVTRRRRVDHVIIEEPARRLKRRAGMLKLGQKLGPATFSLFGNCDGF
jgi:hypothetical protein